MLIIEYLLPGISTHISEKHNDRQDQIKTVLFRHICVVTL